MFSSPDRLFTTLARAELLTWTLLLAGMAGKYLFGLGQLGVTVGGSLHGFVFLAYCLVAVLVGIDQRWKLTDVALGLASAVLPYATAVFERYAHRHSLLATHWRLRAERPSGPLEHPVAVVLRRPLPATLVLLMLIAGVFSGLLMLGPPTEWFS